MDPNKMHQVVKSQEQPRYFLLLLLPTLLSAGFVAARCCSNVVACGSYRERENFCIRRSMWRRAAVSESVLLVCRRLS